MLLKVFKDAEGKVGNAGGDISLQGVIGSRTAVLSEKRHEHDETMNIEDRLSHAGDSFALRKKGEKLRAAGQLPQAIDRFKSAQESCLRINDTKWYLENTLDVAATEFLLGRRVEARRDARLTSEKCEAIKNIADRNSIRARCQILIALTESQPSLSQKAISEIEKPSLVYAEQFLCDLRILTRDPDVISKIARSEVSLARIYKTQNKQEKALSLYDDAISRLKKLNQPELQDIVHERQQLQVSRIR